MLFFWKLGMIFSMAILEQKMSENIDPNQGWGLVFSMDHDPKMRPMINEIPSQKVFSYFLVCLLYKAEHIKNEAWL